MLITWWFFVFVTLISPVRHSLSRHVRTAFTDSPVCSLSSRTERTSAPRGMIEPRQAAAQLLADSSRCRNRRTMPMSPYHSHSVKP
ncbi:MAG: hypothetical protein K1V77_05205 [Muribaculaceae bacterium]